MAGDQRHRVIQIGVGLLALVDGALPEGALLAVTGGIGEQHRQRHLALTEIVAHRFAKRCLIGRVIQRVINQLERHAERRAVLAKRLFLGQRTIRHHGTHFTGRREQSRRLAADHLQILRLTGGQIVLRDQLQHFTLSNRRRGAAENIEHFQRAVSDHQLKGAGKEKIANQHGGLVAEHRIGAGQTATQQALIDHIVMQQRGGVDEFDAGGEVDMPMALIGAHAGSGQGEQRADALATGSDEMGGQLRNQFHIAVHVGDDGAVAFLQIGIHQTDQPRQRILCRTAGLGAVNRIDGRHS